MLVSNLSRKCAYRLARELVPRRFIRYTSTDTSAAWQRSRAYTQTYGAIAVCCSLFAYNLYADDQNDKKHNKWHRDFIDKNLVLSEDNYNAGRWWTMITHSVMHPNGIHLACNMVALSSFGPASIMLFGLPSTAFLWVGSGLVGAWATLAGKRYKAMQARGETSPNELEAFDHSVLRGQFAAPNPAQRSVGASSSILGLFVAIACSRPKSTVWIIPIPFPVQMGTVAVGLGLASAIAYTQDLMPLFGHTGHLGGMSFGALYYFLALRRRMRFPR